MPGEPEPPKDNIWEREFIDTCGSYVHNGEMFLRGKTNTRGELNVSLFPFSRRCGGDLLGDPAFRPVYLKILGGTSENEEVLVAIE